MKRLAAALVAGTLTLSLAACGSGDEDNDSGSSSKTVKIGVMGPKTSATPQYWTDAIRPMELAAAELGPKYGLDVELVEADDQGTPDGASQAVQKLLNQDKVDAIFGPPLSGNALQIADVVQRTGRPWILATLAPELINEELEENWAFRTNYNADDLSSVVGQLMFAGDRKVGVVYSAEAYGQSGLKSMEAQAKEQGAEIAAAEPIQPGASDFNAGVARLKAAGVDNVFIAISAGADTATVTKAIAQGGLDPELVVTNATIMADFSKLADPEQWKNLVFIDSRDLTGDSIASIASDYKKEYGEDPILPTNVHSFMLGLDAYLQAVAEVGDAKDYDGVREAMEGLESVSIGSDTFDSPFAKDDHELYESESPEEWFVFGFDEKGTLTNRGNVAECISSGC